jgi:ADP-ribose pyrophosphatase
VPETWQTLSEETVFEARPIVRVVRQQVRTGAGRVIPDFYQVLLRRFTLCVPVTVQGKVLVIRQYKHGPGRVSITFPGGFVDEGEDPQAACRRELLEEAGMEAGALVPLGSFVDNGNQLGCRGSYYIARDCRRIAEPDSGDLERMELLEMTPEEIDAELANGGFAIIHHAALWSMARLRGL